MTSIRITREMILAMGASRGLGFLMIDGQMTGRASIILASVILFACLGKATDLVLELVGKRHLP